jgi:hypothetical protein
MNAVMEECKKDAAEAVADKDWKRYGLAKKTELALLGCIDALAWVLGGAKVKIGPKPN